MLYFIPPTGSTHQPIVQPEGNHIGIRSLERSGWEQVPRTEYEEAMERWREGRDAAWTPDGAA